MDAAWWNSLYSKVDALAQVGTGLQLGLGLMRGAEAGALLQQAERMAQLVHALRADVRSGAAASGVQLELCRGDG